MFIVNDTINSGDGIGKAKFQYISEYSTIWTGGIDTFRG
jgi:hypothetical protein